MNKRELQTLARLLLYLEDEDLGELGHFKSGEWSRRNLDALIEDVEELAAKAKAGVSIVRVSARFAGSRFAARSVPIPALTYMT